MMTETVAGAEHEAEKQGICENSGHIYYSHAHRDKVLHSSKGNLILIRSGSHLGWWWSDR